MDATLNHDHKLLRDTFRAEIRRRREYLGDEQLQESKLFQMYSDATVFADKYPTHDQRIRYIRQTSAYLKHLTAQASIVARGLDSALDIADYDEPVNHDGRSL